ncbi:potassium transporter TrkA [Micromonospora sp. 4G57]|uniref:Potassium transporter TrkA n=1 Tax=Micromonospora sicca TaxID=2202420 RepID=A0ABU5J945_9ACTN|nr:MULTISPECIES: potassium transporter TrkA [unclassified Micromonospora]MDZ5442297.1 potassium transporter TrkA [Micromonospora sp. 4G57]MDZ5489102.1 potassium transporter TrkA [Micromonospora sp. 4G53]
MTPRHIAVVGSGALARALAHSLAALAPSGPAARSDVPVTITLLARDGGAVAGLARICRARAAVSGNRVSFTAEPLADEVETLRRLRPDVLVCCASAQSPYERVTAPSAWTRLIAEAGFGVTLPLQATLAVRLARAVARVSPGTRFVNGAFPDVVNPLLAALDLPVLCGIGNVSTLAACLRAGLNLAAADRLAMLGHHVHLAAPTDPADEVMAWSNGSPVTGVTALLAADRALPRRELNAVAGHAAARLLLDLVSGTEIHTNLPGPMGLPGGYPVRISAGTIALDLPAGITRIAAVDWNLRVGRRDGVQVVDGRIEYPPAAAAAIADHLPHIADGWTPSALDQVTEELTALRGRLRLAPPAPAPARLA